MITPRTKDRRIEAWYSDRINVKKQKLSPGGTRTQSRAERQKLFEPRIDLGTPSELSVNSWFKEIDLLPPKEKAAGSNPASGRSYPKKVCHKNLQATGFEPVPLSRLA